MTFALTGFSSVRRDGIELQGSFAATVNAELTIGRGHRNDHRVTGETPVVDTQSTRRQTVIGNELISSIPAARAYAGLMTLMPNTVVAGGAASDVQVVPGMVVFGSAGGRGNEGRLQVDGLSVGSAFNGAGVSSYIPDVGNAQEITMTTSGGLGEAEVGGPALNIVPKTGGNTIKGGFYASGVTKGMVGSNYTQDLKDRGLTTPGTNTKIWDFNSASADRSEGSVVVLRTLARRRQSSDRARHVREPERGRSDQVDLRARSEPAGRGGRVVPHDLAAAHLAGDAAQSVPPLLG